MNFCKSCVGLPGLAFPTLDDVCAIQSRTAWMWEASSCNSNVICALTSILYVSRTWHLIV